MNDCKSGEPNPSIEILRAYAMKEVYGDGAGELAAHIENCDTCTKRLGVLQVVGRCNQILRSVRSAAPPIAAVWKRIAGEEFALQDAIVVSQKRRRGLDVRWASGSDVVSSLPVHSLLESEGGKQIEMAIPILGGESGMPCSLKVLQDPIGSTRVGVDFGKQTTQEHGILQVRLVCGDQLIESQNVADASWIVFGMIRLPGDYTIELRGQAGTFRVSLLVE